MIDLYYIHRYKVLTNIQMIRGKIILNYIMRNYFRKSM